MLVGLAGLAFGTGGCQAIGYFASAIPQSVDAQYKGLAGEKVAVMIWADRGLRIDFPNLQLDTGNGIQSFLLAKTDEDSLKKTQFPWEVRSVLRFQKEHPELESRSITEYAHRISGVTKLIFVEIGDFSTRSGTAVQLFRGGMTANLKVLDVKPGASTVVYEKQHIQVNFPPKSPEGVIDASEALIYNGTVNAMSLEIAELFYPHVIED
jgi:hypothetical protein